MGRFFSLGQKNSNIKVPQKNYRVQSNTNMNIDNNISLNASTFSGEKEVLSEKQKKFYKLFGSFGTFFKNLGQSMKNTGSQFVSEVKSWFGGIFSKDVDIQKATGVDTVSRTVKGVLGTLEGWFDTIVEGMIAVEYMDQYSSENEYERVFDNLMAEISPTAKAQQEANKAAFEAKQKASKEIIEYDVSEKLYQDFLAYILGDMTLEEMTSNSQLGELLGSGFESLGGMLPNLVATIVSGGANLGPKFTKLVSFISIFASTNGMSLEDALNSGLDMDEATRKAFAEGLIEASIESIDGKMFGLNLDKEVTEGVIKEYIKSVFGEMGEETLSLLMGPMVEIFTNLEGNMLDKYTDFFSNAENADELAATLYTTIMTVTALNSGNLSKAAKEKAQKFLNNVDEEIKIIAQDIAKTNNTNQEQKIEMLEPDLEIVQEPSVVNESETNSVFEDTLYTEVEAPPVETLYTEEEMNNKVEPGTNVFEVLFDDFPEIIDDLHAAKLLYNRLNEFVSYNPEFSAAGITQNHVLEKQLYDQKIDYTNMQDNLVVCTNWADMYSAALTSLGIENSIRGGYHKWVVFSIGGRYFFADGTNNFNYMTDVGSSKVGISSNGFFEISLEQYNDENFSTKDNFSLIRKLNYGFEEENLKLDEDLGYNYQTLEDLFISSEPWVTEYELKQYGLDENASLADLVNAKMQTRFMNKLNQLDIMEAIAYGKVLFKTQFTSPEIKLIEEYKFVNENNELAVAYSVNGSRQVYFYEGKNKASTTTLTKIRNLGYLLWEEFKK